MKPVMGSAGAAGESKGEGKVGLFLFDSSSSVLVPVFCLLAFATPPCFCVCSHAVIVAVLLPAPPLSGRRNCIRVARLSRTWRKLLAPGSAPQLTPARLLCTHPARWTWTRRTRTRRSCSARRTRSGATSGGGSPLFKSGSGSGLPAAFTRRLPFSVARLRRAVRRAGVRVLRWLACVVACGAPPNRLRPDRRIRVCSSTRNLCPFFRRSSAGATSRRHQHIATVMSDITAQFKAFRSVMRCVCLLRRFGLGLRVGADS